MRTIAQHRLMATVVIAALLGVIAGFSVTSQSTAGSVSVASSAYYDSTACVSHTWLWVPAMRRAR